MPWQDHQTALNTDILAEYAEPLTLANSSVIQGIYHTTDTAPNAIWDETGLDVRLSDKPTPYAMLLAADAAALAEGDLITARGEHYQIARKHPTDNAGWVRIDLLAEQLPLAGGRWQ